jgi:hypothetical protein
MFSVALTQYNNVHKTAHIKCPYAYHTPFPFKSTFLEPNMQYFSPHTVDIAPQSYTPQLISSSTNVEIGGVVTLLLISEVMCSNLNAQTEYYAA